MESFLMALPADKIALVVTKIPTAFLTLFVGIVILKIIQGLIILALRAAHVTRVMQIIIIQVISIVLWAGVLALTLQSLGLNQIAIALSGSIAIVGIGVTSGATKLVSDIVAGLYLARNRDFKIGERIELPEVKGRIHSLDARKVRILGDDGALFIVPNSKFDDVVWKVAPGNQKEKKDG